MGGHDYGQAFSTGRSNPAGFPNQLSHQQCLQCLLSVESAGPGEQPLPWPLSWGSSLLSCQQCPHSLLNLCQMTHGRVACGGLCPGTQLCGQSSLVPFTGTSNLLILPWSDGPCKFFLCCATFIIRCQWLSVWQSKSLANDTFVAFGYPAKTTKGVFLCCIFLQNRICRMVKHEPISCVSAPKEFHWFMIVLIVIQF